MTRLLHLDSSPRGERSHSRHLSGLFVNAFKAVHPDLEVVYRDLGHNPVPHVDETWIAGAYLPPENQSPEMKDRMKTSDMLVDELIAADYVVLGAPMYNFNVPSTLKAYIDQVIRLGRTFAMDKGNYVALLPSGKKLLVVTSRGGMYRPGMPAAPYDMQEPFLKLAFGFMGITDATFVHADGLNFGDEQREKSLAEAESALHTAAKVW
jgi:FMN-dependent NADH-azoreductase